MPKRESRRTRDCREIEQAEISLKKVVGKLDRIETIALDPKRCLEFCELATKAHDLLKGVLVRWDIEKMDAAGRRAIQQHERLRAKS